ncbi:glycosyltransferase 87 family protein [Kocuria rhizophila]|uniref:glycosyltransferase 87 family protein n=1 Tax=Kocuria rhizophila TaxID=72000 RepID=UPI001EF5F50D|nr:glycosyltransferase 87 family protein [Kocuria rhizophila]MCG7425303.1 glycosyltransferase 87 family protein [Kocuria rhizophila]
MSLEGARNRSGASAGLMLLGVGLYTVMMAYLIRIPCHVPEWNVAEQVPQLCATVIDAGDLGVHSSDVAGGFFTGGPTGDQPVLVGIITTIIGWFASNLSSLMGLDVGQGFYLDLSVVLLALVWLAIVAVVSSLSGNRSTDALVMALSPVVVLVGFQSWDLWAVLFMMLAVLGYVRGNPAVAGIMVGFGASVAFFPVVVLLAILIMAARHRFLKDIVSALLWAVFAWAVINGTYMLTAWDRWLAQFNEMVRSDTGSSSLWNVWGSTVEPRTGVSLGAGDGGQFVLLSMVLALVFVLLVALLSKREPSVVQVTFLLLALYILLAKEYSLTYVLWLVPLVILCRRNWVEFALWQVVETLYWATVVLPSSAWPTLPWVQEFGWSAQDLLAVVRYAFLVYLVVAVVVDMFRGRKAAALGASAVQ